jgi:Putative prokaryotic signal transducing protein
MSAEESRHEVQPLACPRCARRYTLDERFCSECGMPLVYIGRGEQEPITASHERARKVKPQYTGGQAVRVVGAANLAEAEMIQGILLEEGIPSYQRRSRGFDVPDFLAAGPRDILVPEAGAEAAREVLAQTPVGEAAATPGSRTAQTRPLRLLAAIVGAMAGAAALAWLLYQVTT